MNRLSLIATVIPLVIVAIGLIGWVLTLRNDVTDTVQQIDGFHEELSGIHAQLENGMKDVHQVVSALHERIIELEKSLLVANDQMQTIMGDHMGFADVLEEMGRSGVLPAGERRAYGGYGN